MSKLEKNAITKYPFENKRTLKVELFDYKLKCVTGEFFSEDFYLLNKTFIDPKYVLSTEYVDLGKFIELPYFEEGEILFVEKPYINDKNEFVGFGLDTLTDNDIDYQKVIELLGYLKELRTEDEVRFENVDWDSMADILGFTPSKSVYPQKYATEDEALPDAIENWIVEDDKNKAFISDLGVGTDENIDVKCRQYFNDDLKDFDEQKLYTLDNVNLLENIFVWLDEVNLFPLAEERKKVVNILVERINTLRGENVKKLELDFEIDWETLEQEVEEYSSDEYLEWKNKYGLTIYLYDGTMPGLMTLSEYTDEVVYYENSKKNVVCNKENLSIYVNSKKDVMDALQQFVVSEENDCITKEAFNYLNNSIRERELEKLQRKCEEQAKEIERLKNGPKMSYEEPSYSGMSDEEKKYYNEQAKEQILSYLESLGYNIANVNDAYSCVSGVTKDGKEYPLVIRSYKTKRGFELSAPDWLQLSKENAMLWILDSDGRPKCIPFDRLMSNQGNITIRFNTQNFDNEDWSSQQKMLALATVLRWFKGLHFDFDSLPNNLTTAEQLFSDEKKMTDKDWLSLRKGDDDSLIN